MRRLNPRRNKQGILLLEALLAIVILTVSISIIIESLVSGLRATVFTADYSKAVLLADSAMSDAMRQRFVDASFRDEGDFPRPNDDFHYEITTEQLAEYESRLQDVHLTVSWKSGSRERDVTFATWLPDVSQKVSVEENPYAAP